MEGQKVVPFKVQEGISPSLLNRLLESFSIDVIGTLKNLGKTSKVANRVSEAYNYYGIILLE